MDLQTIISTSSSQPGIQIENYDGPLDVLIALIEKADISIYDVSIADITDQYLLYLAEHGSTLSIEAISEFQLMASYLVYLKARMLLPKDKEEEKKVWGEREEFIELLLRYHRYRKLAEALADAITAPELLRNDVNMLLLHDENAKFASPATLLLQFRNYYEHLLRIRQIYRTRGVDSINTQVKQDAITELLNYKKKFTFYEIIKEHKKVIETICTFLALLQLAKGNILELYQEEFWGDIICYAKGIEHE